METIRKMRRELSTRLKREVTTFHNETGKRVLTVLVDFTDGTPDIDSVFLPEGATVGIEEEQLVIRVPLTPPPVDAVAQLKPEDELPG